MLCTGIRHNGDSGPNRESKRIGGRQTESACYFFQALDLSCKLDERVIWTTNDDDVPRPTMPILGQAVNRHGSKIIVPARIAIGTSEDYHGTYDNAGSSWPRATSVCCRRWCGCQPYTIDAGACQLSDLSQMLLKVYHMLKIQQLVPICFIMPMIALALSDRIDAQPCDVSLPDSKSSPTNPSTPVRAYIDDMQPGWRALTQADFAKVNSADDTWRWEDGTLHCTGEPLSVLRTTAQYVNFELVVEWMHEKSAGNSGVFVWVTPDSIEKLTSSGQPGLPDGIEVQILDHGFTEQMKANGNKTDWFGTNGDVFAVNVKMTPFPPLSPNGKRSFPRKHLAKGHGNWNHYYIRGINGEVRLWVNGEEVSGGNGCDPASGYLCLESEGSPIQFRKLRIRELP